MSDLRPARVRVPCSTSNLGSGYDTIGLALERLLAPLCIRSADYGTRSQTVLLIERGGAGLFVERTLDPEGATAGTARHRLEAT